MWGRRGAWNPISAKGFRDPSDNMMRVPFFLVGSSISGNQDNGVEFETGTQMFNKLQFDSVHPNGDVGLVR